MLLRAGLLQYMWKERIVSKYHIKICIKSNQEEQSVFKIMNRTTPKETQVYEITVWARVEVANNFILGGVPLCTQGMSWDIPQRRELKQIATGYFETVSQSGCCSAWEQVHFFLKCTLLGFKPLASYTESRVNLTEY